MQSGIVALCLALIALTESSMGAEWPQFRADAARSGYVDGQIPSGLSLRWAYRSRHQPAEAWLGTDTRMPFDRAYQPVIARGLLYFGGSADGKVCALDASTGAERWTFYTGAAVRFAPALWEGRVFVVSDDGWLYCLSGETGEIIWKRLGGPKEDLLLGNARMISRWPARGGPVILDGIVYFGAGIWPSEGIYLYALDAASGEVLWLNGESGGIEWDQPHGGARARSGISAQGYLAATAKHLFIPTGRGVPATFSRADGQLRHFPLQAYGRVGGADLVAVDDNFFNSGHWFDASTGKSGGLAIPPIDPKAHKLHMAGHLAIEGGLANPLAAAPDKVVFAAGHQLAASNWIEEKVIERKGEERIAKRLQPIHLWHGTSLSNQTQFVNAPHEVTAMILVGKKIVLGGSGQVSIMRPPEGGEASSIWTMPVEGIVHGLAFAGDHLYVSTDHGLIYCFGSDRKVDADWHEVKIPAAPYGENARYASAAEEIIRLTGVTEGYAVDLGCGDGALAYELARRTRLQIYAIERNPQLVRQAREKLDRAGLYGSRVTVHLGDPANSKYPNYFADLAVSGRSIASGDLPNEQEMLRLNRPSGGLACTGPVGSMQTRVRGPLNGAGAWTHQYADAANTAVSADDLVKSPLGMLWFRDYEGIELPMRHGRGPAPLFSNGRLFIMGLHGVYAINAYNGHPLWDYSIPDILRAYDQHHLAGTSITGGKFCIDEDALYIRHDDRCLRLHAVTGKKLAEYTLPQALAGRTNTWGFVAVSDGALFGSVANEEHVVKFPYSRGEKPSMEELFSESTALFAMDAATGRLRWIYRAKHSIRHNAIAIGDGRVCLIDRPAAQDDLLDQQRRRGIESGERTVSELITLDAATGEVLWRKSDGIFGTLLAMSVEHDALLMSYQRTRFQLTSERGGKWAAYRVSDGKMLWEIKADYASRPILNGRTIYAQPGAWDLLTGERKDFTLTRSYGCSIVAGSKNLLTFRSATLGFRDLTRPDAMTENYGGIRPGCWLNAISAGGLLLMPDDSDKCTCSYLNKAYIALQPMAD